MEPNTEGNLLEIMDLARTLRQEQLFIQQEQAAFGQLTETLSENSTLITRLAYICAQQRQNLNSLIVSRPEIGPLICCRRANNYENAKFVDAKKVMDYEHAIAYEELFNHLYRSPYLLAISLATGDRIAEITQQHMSCVIHTISTGIYGNAINTKDVEMILKLLRELIEVQIVSSDNPIRLLRANSSSFARLYHRLNESMFSAKIFLTAALFEPIMGVLSDGDTMLDVDPSKVVESFTTKERLRRFGAEDSNDYHENILKFHKETISKLYQLAKSFINSLNRNWSLFPSTLRWLVQTMCHHLKQTHFSDKIINEVITNMVFTHFICPAIVSPDIVGIIDAPISEQVRFNLMQIGQIIQMLALAKHDDKDAEVDSKFAEIHAKFEANMVTHLIDLLLVSQSGEDVVAILSQQSDFERSHLLSTQNDLVYFVEFFRILIAHDEYDITMEERKKLKKILSHIPESAENSQSLQVNGGEGDSAAHTKEQRSNKQSFMSLGKVTKSKIAKSMSFNITATTEAGVNGADSAAATIVVNGNGAANNGNHQSVGQTPLTNPAESPQNNIASSNTPSSSTHSSPVRAPIKLDSTSVENEPILVFNIYNSDENKLQPLTEEEVLKMNSIGQEISNGDEGLLADESCNLENGIDKSVSLIVNGGGYDGIDNLNDVLRPLHAKAGTRFSLSHDDASIGNSDNLEAVSEAPSNHSVTSSLELEENDQNDNLSDMISANVSGRGTPNISGRDTPSSQVTDGESVTNALPTPQMQKLISKARSDIEDKFCKFEIKKFEGDETVSIISDTWSTDVLASDSETLDASERERDRDRDRNFSTPLIPSNVVLPGDNNFDALSGAGGVMRPSYLDVSDQRSESNWSTDVLASDSEKLAEIDTDDNLSITAKSDITDAGVRSEERDLLAAAISASVDEPQQRTPDSPYYVVRSGGRRGFNHGSSQGRSTSGVSMGTIADVTSGVRGVGVEVGGNGSVSGVDGRHGSVSSDHSQEDSAFFDAINLYEESIAAQSTIGANLAANPASAVGEEDDAGGELLSSAASLHQYQLSSLARSSVRTTNNENSFQQNYKSSFSSHHHNQNNNNNKSSNNNNNSSSFIPTVPRMRRQMSAESSISNQSFNLEDVAGGGAVAGIGKPPTKSHHHHHKGGIKKKKQQQHNNTTSTRSSAHTDLIDFSDFSDDRTRSTATGVASTTLTTNSAATFLDIFSDDPPPPNADVEHRRISTEQRSAGFDGRRNGIRATNNGTGGENGTNSVSSTTPSLRRHQSLNYENHEIAVLNAATTPTRISSLLPNFSQNLSQTDDDKSEQRQQQQQIMMLCAKTEELQLNNDEADNNNSDLFNGTSTVILTNGESAGGVSRGVGASGVGASTSSLSAPKPTKATGAIPKSISFDASADKNGNTATSRPISHRGGRGNDAQRHGAGGSGSSAGHSGIFNKLKQGIFKNRRSNKASSSSIHRHSAAPTGLTDEFTHNGRSVSFSKTPSDAALDLLSGISGAGGVGRNMSTGYCDITEDILAKYRRKVSTSSEATNSDSTGNSAAAGLSKRNISDAEAAKQPTLHDKAVAFNIVKKKIRTVLSKTDLHTGDFRHTTYSNASPLLTYLQIQLAQAINLQNFQQISYVSEAIRCISALEPNQHIQLLEELQNDIQKRQNYLQYLMRYRQNLLLIMENIDQFETRLRGESSICNRYLMAVCIRQFLEKRESKIVEFQEEFARLTMSDDKIDLIEEFIDLLMTELVSNGGILHGMSEWQSHEARISIERILLQRMYHQVMFPNEDADLSRDTVLSEHIRKLQTIIRPSHPALCIPQAFLSEAPWSFAQQQLSYISAYKTPREKLQCVIRCISSIMSLLHMSSGRVPAADDLLPVLIYVVIMTNPPYLLSTVEYITCFIGEKLDGEEQFHWTLFGSVVKFIKTMDYLD